MQSSLQRFADGRENEVPTAGRPEAKRVRNLFDSVAGRYDLMNRVASLGLDARWRRRAVDRLLAGGTPRRALDLFSGTGDLARELRRRGVARVVSADFSLGMLRRQVERDLSGRAVAADARALPFAAESFDAVVGAFGIRNVAERALALAEIRRVLRPGGRALLLEFCPPPGGLWGAAVRLWTRRFVPAIARVLSPRPEAYRYLAESVERFPRPDAFACEWVARGFDAVETGTLFPGIVFWIHGRKGRCEPRGVE